MAPGLAGPGPGAFLPLDGPARFPVFCPCPRRWFLGRVAVGGRVAVELAWLGQYFAKGITMRGLMVFSRLALAATLAVMTGLFWATDAAFAALASSTITTVTTDIATYQTMVSTVMAAVILVVLARVGWRLLRRLVSSF